MDLLSFPMRVSWTSFKVPSRLAGEEDDPGIIVLTPAGGPLLFPSVFIADWILSCRRYSSPDEKMLPSRPAWWIGRSKVYRPLPWASCCIGLNFCSPGQRSPEVRILYATCPFNFLESSYMALFFVIGFPGSHTASGIELSFGVCVCETGEYMHRRMGSGT